MGNTLTFERMTEKSVMNLVERIADSNKDAGDQLHRLKKSMLKSLHSLVHSFPNESFSFKELVENERFSLYMGGSLDYPVAQPDPLKDPQPVYRVFIDDGKLWFNQPDEYIIPANKLSVEAICEMKVCQKAHLLVVYAQSPDFHKLGDWKQSSKQDSLACQGRDNRDNFSAVKSQFQFTDSVANNLFIIQTATLFRLRSHIQQIVKYVCFGFIGILKSVRIIL